MKNNFVMRTGKDEGPSVADEIEKRLAEANLLPSRRKIPRSTLNRLLSSEPIRQRVGISMKGGKFVFVRDPNKSLLAITRIANDLANRKIVLGDIWDLDGKLGYLDRLDHDGVLPSASSSVLVSNTKQLTSNHPKIRPTSKLAPSTRENLISRKDYGIVWNGKLQRHHQIWEELQFYLELNKHPNAISVLMRVLIEISLEHYIKEANVLVNENDKLAVRLKKAGAHLQSLGKINVKQMDIINKFGQGEKIVSADTLNRYIHSSDFAPSPDHLTSIWDSLANIIVHFLME